MEIIDNSDVSVVSIRDVCGRIASHLRGKLTVKNEHFYIQVVQPETGCFMLISIQPANELNNAINLLIEIGDLRRGTIQWRLDYKYISHLYLTWDTPLHIIFCHVLDTHFFLFNIDNNCQLQVMSGIDKRRDETEETKADMVRKRRIFHHIGALNPANEQE